MRGAWGVAILTAGLAVALAGCVPQSVKPENTTVPSPSASPGATGAPAEPMLIPEGTATDNLPYFDLVNNKLVTAGGPFDGRSWIDNLVTAGFSKSAMEVTPDRTTVNAEADQLQFSVRINGTCLIGQYGAGVYNSGAFPLLATGTCLVGATRPIDW
jgi:hypothetical protein